MLHSDINPELDLEPITFPWSAASNDPRGAYVNFRERPELIARALEDFRPWARTAAVKEFYDLLRWINGPESMLESVGCAFGTRETHDVVRGLDGPWCVGWLSVILRDHPLNLNRDLTDELKRLINAKARAAPGPVPDGCIIISEALTQFVYLEDFYTGFREPPVGWSVVINWMVTAEAKRAALSALRSTFRQLRWVLAEVSQKASTVDRWKALPTLETLKAARAENLDRLLY